MGPAAEDIPWVLTWLVSRLGVLSVVICFALLPHVIFENFCPVLVIHDELGSVPLGFFLFVVYRRAPAPLPLSVDMNILSVGDSKLHLNERK